MLLGQLEKLNFIAAQEVEELNYIITECLHDYTRFQVRGSTPSHNFGGQTVTGWIGWMTEWRAFACQAGQEFLFLLELKSGRRRSAS